MAASETVKLCLTKTAILFTHASAQVDLRGGKRHFSVEWTHDREISGEIPSLCPAGAFGAPATAQNKARTNATCNNPQLFTQCGRPLASQLDSRTSVAVPRDPAALKPTDKGPAASSQVIFSVFSRSLTSVCLPFS